MHDRQTTPRQRLAGWFWLRALMAVWFAFYINFVPIHLVTQAHLDDLIFEGVQAESSGAAVGQEHADDHDPHATHLASDHTLRFVPQGQVCFAAVDAVPVGSDVPILVSLPQLKLFLTERQNPPGQLVPDPFQPRAPPIV